MSSSDEQLNISESDIAVVGMSGRFPGARNPEEFWRNIRDGVESIRRYSDQELNEAGVPSELLHNPHYVKAGAPLDEMEFFDAEFFGFSPKDAAIMDPQHRQLLECAWEALEDAGHPPERFDGSIGVYAGCGMNAYMMFNLLSNPDLMNSVGLFLVRHTGNDKDFLATRISYCLNLTGPSVNVQTACSTSLVAIHIATQNLLSGECDMALAGGVTVELPHRRGYLYEEGEILSPDGRCRAFDHRSQGTVFGSGAGIVVLRRLADAVADADHIYAVIKGSAINNDGSSKIGYLAPSVDGQAKAIVEALSVANVDADSIQYVESHGTGTPVGDPIEIAALTQAFRGSTERAQFCRIGSVKTNIGHLDTAAGIASFIKVCQALRHAQMPPSLHFEAPNPTIDFASSPFIVNAALRDWPKLVSPRRAGISSLGVGGTNAHVIVEEAPSPTPSDASRAWQVLTLAARNPAALDETSKRLASWLREHPEKNLGDVAWTLHVGRREFDQRRSVVARNATEAADALEGKDTSRVATRRAQSEKTSVVFLFPGGGAQHPRMGLELYEREPVFRKHVDRGLNYLREHQGPDLAPLLFPQDGNLLQAGEAFQRPSQQLPAIFIIEVALAELWKSWGIQPAAMIGHSMGENTAACIAGVMRYEDALGLVTLRGKLFERIPPGGMLSVPLQATELAPLLSGQLAMASINGPSLSVVSGPNAELDTLARLLTARGIESQRVKIDIAAHSSMLEPILSEFGDYLRNIRLSPPEIPFASNLTGTWITPEQAVDPDYWVRHLRNTVRFADGVACLLEQPGRVLLEVGPGKTLSSLARQNEKLAPGQLVLSSMRHPDEAASDLPFLLGVLGRLWTAGVAVDWPAFHSGETHRRVSLPTYAFQRQKYWIAPGEAVYKKQEEEDKPLTKIPQIEDWFYRPIWRPEALETVPVADLRWLIFVDQAGIGTRLAERLHAIGEKVFTVREGDAFYRISKNEFAVSPEEGRAGYDALLRELSEAGQLPDRILHLWTLTADEHTRPGSSFFHHIEERGFYSLLFIAQALGDLGHSEPLHFCVVSNGAHQVGEEPLPHPVKATLLGPCRVIPQEFPGYTCVNVDVELPDLQRRLGRKQSEAQRDQLVEQLFNEARATAKSGAIALHGGKRLKLEFERASLQPLGSGRTRLRDSGTYMITGGMGGIGLVIAGHLARTRKARLILVGREVLPARELWDATLASPETAERMRRKLRWLRELEALGAEVMPVSADVADLKQMHEVVSEGKRRFGAIHGVFHAAGILDDDLIQLKTQEAIDEVFTPKIQGTLVLDQLLARDNLDFLVLFSSTSSVLGAAGQVDYVAANAFLNAFAQSRSQKKGAYTVAVQWGIWTNVGMAANAAADSAREEKTSFSHRKRTGHPLLEFRGTSSRDEIVFESVWSTRDQWVLDEHRTISGQALLPGTGYLEIARAATVEVEGPGSVQIANLDFVSPLAVEESVPRAVRITLSKGTGDYAFRVESRVADTHAEYQLHAQAQITHTEFPAVDPIQIEAIRSRCTLSSLDDPNGIRTHQEDHLSFGPRWRCLRRIDWGTNEALAELELPAPFAKELAEFPLHPALLDLATGYAMELVPGYGDGKNLYVPLSYRRVSVRGSLTHHVFSWVRGATDNDANKDIATFDVVIADATGKILVEVEHFTVRKIVPGMSFSGPTKISALAAADQSAYLSPAERSFRQALAAGILPEEGISVLEQVLAAEQRPQIIASSIELQALVNQVRAATPAPSAGGQKFSRPSLSSEYKAPSNEVETALVAIWEELLGVDQVGVQDDFFELGGHSLIAVRLFAQIKKRFGVDYAISVLFEAPTIEKCALLVRAKTSSDGIAIPEKKEFQYLVPMHIGDQSTKSSPFFLVAGMFGNVLNLRHLASLVGRERPFYAVQAKGLRGDEEPHRDFVEMARAYLAEVRQVQPHGPYFLGGFSGGGISAYEMAQQLRADGEKVALVVLLDTPLPKQSRADSMSDKLTIHWQKIMRRGPTYLSDWIRDKVRRKLEKHQNLEVAGSSPYEFRSKVIEQAFYDALAIYEVCAYGGQVVLFRPKLAVAHVLLGGRIVNMDREFLYPDNGWGQYVGNLEVHEVPGDHDSMVLEPSVRVLASRLREALQNEELKRQTQKNNL